MLDILNYVVFFKKFATNNNYCIIQPLCSKAIFNKPPIYLISFSCGSKADLREVNFKIQTANLLMKIFIFNFRAVFMEFYGRNDITLGGFLEMYCFRYNNNNNY